MEKSVSPSSQINIVSKVLANDGHFPNNPRLPILIYRQALAIKNSQEVQKLFLQNGWKKPWIYEIYAFHHYHSNTHEVIGVSSGGCEVQLGGEHGPVFHIKKGDVLFIPAGVAHKSLETNGEFECVGAYPFDIEFDMNYGTENVANKQQMIAAVPLPLYDPVYGSEGPLLEYWK